jgi:hypothetical protein
MESSESNDGERMEGLGVLNVYAAKIRTLVNENWTLSAFFWGNLFVEWQICSLQSESWMDGWILETASRVQPRFLIVPVLPLAGTIPNLLSAVKPCRGASQSTVCRRRAKTHPRAAFTTSISNQRRCRYISS